MSSRTALEVSPALWKHYHPFRAVTGTRQDTVLDKLTAELTAFAAFLRHAG